MYKLMGFFLEFYSIDDNYSKTFRCYQVINTKHPIKNILRTQILDQHVKIFQNKENKVQFRFSTCIKCTFLKFFAALLKMQVFFFNQAPK